MSSSAKRYRDNLSKETKESGIEMAPCTKCRNARVKPGQTRPKCIVGPKSGRCSECIRKGRTDCDVTVSRPEWEAIRDSRNALRLQLEESEEKEIELMHQLAVHRSRTLRLRKQLRQAENRTDTAVAAELDALDEVEGLEAMMESSGSPLGVEVAEQPSFHGILDMPVSQWEAIDGLPDDFWSFAAGGSGTSELVPAS
jgi:hypothetical protein